MWAIDVATRFVQLSTQFVSVPLVMRGTASRRARTAPLDRLKLLRDVFYLLVQCRQ